jgi:hypothetical protein
MESTERTQLKWLAAASNLEFLQSAFGEQRIHFEPFADQTLLVGVLYQSLQDMAIGFQPIGPWIGA